MDARHANGAPRLWSNAEAQAGGLRILVPLDDSVHAQRVLGRDLALDIEPVAHARGVWRRRSRVACAGHTPAVRVSPLLADGLSLWVAREELVDEDLWQAMLLWLPPDRTDVRGGLPRVSNRAALAGILFVLRHGLRWRDLPQELGFGSGVTAGDACACGKPSAPGRGSTRHC